MHANLHRLFKIDFFRSDIAEPRTGNWIELRKILEETLDSASFRTIWRGLINSPTYLSRSFHAGSIQSAFDNGVGTSLYGTGNYVILTDTISSLPLLCREIKKLITS